MSSDLTLTASITCPMVPYLPLPFLVGELGSPYYVSRLSNELCKLHRRLLDIREVPSLVPDSHLNETAKLIEAELSNRIVKLKEKIDSGALETDDDSQYTSCNDTDNN